MGVLQAGGIELLLPGSGVAGQPKAFMLRETTDSSAPSFMFADLDGRLSKPTCASASHSACAEVSRHSICLLPGSARILAGPVMLRRRASTLLSPAQEITTADPTQQHHAMLRLCFHLQEARLGELVGSRLPCRRPPKGSVLLSQPLERDSHIVELSSLSGHAGVAGQVKRKYDLAMSSPGDQVRVLSTLRISA